jgi:hypothetical protein
MRTLTIGVLLSLALGVPAAAAAQSSSRLAIGTIRGDSSAVRRQILLQVCGPYQCVAASRFTADDRPDPEKLAAGGVSGYLGGAVTGAGADKRVILTLTTPTTTAKKPAHTWRLRLGPDGRLRPQVLERFTIEMDEILQASTAQLPPSPATPPQRQPPPVAKAPPPPPPPPAAKPPPPPKPPPAAKPPPQQAEEKPRPPPQPREERAPRAAYAGPLRFAAEGGLWVTSRKLSYSGANGGSLRTFDASAVLVPSLRLEVYPMALAGNPGRLTSGIGLFLDYGHSIGLKVKPPSGNTEGNHEATLTNLDLGVVWRVQPMSGSGFTVAPALSYRSLQLVTAAKGGVEIDGLPDTKLTGFELRVDLAAPVGDSFRVVGGGGYTLWTSAKDLVKGGFFGKGSARGFEVEGGLQYRILGPLHVKGVLEYQSTSYSGLGSPASSSFVASGATETYFGGRLMVRGEF